MDARLRYATIGELRALLDLREVSPDELAHETLKGLGTHGSALHAVATILPDRARREAARAATLIDRKASGRLAGIPWGAKDLFAVRGAPTTWGVPAYRDRLEAQDATVVRRLGAAGAVLVAKLATIELAGGWGYRYPGASATGAARTPWNTNHWAGGSSSGSGAAVATGVLPFALGSETSGSIVTPAAFCGVTGLRPTLGLVSRAGAMPLSWTLDKIGPLARSALDAFDVLRAIAGPDAADVDTLASTFRYVPRGSNGRRIPGRRRPRLPDLPPVGSLASLRIGYAESDFTEAPVPGARVAFGRALADMQRIGATWVETALPNDLPYGAIVSLIGGVEGAAAHADLIDGAEFETLVDQTQKASLLAAREVLARDYVDALRGRRLVQDAFARIFDDVDIIATIARPDGAPPVDRALDVEALNFPDAPPGNRSIVAAGNVAGLPAIVVPCGFTETGLPVALQLVGPAWSEPLLVAVAAWYQSVTDWHTRRPPDRSP